VHEFESYISELAGRQKSKERTALGLLEPTSVPIASTPRVDVEPASEPSNVASDGGTRTLEQMQQALDQLKTLHADLSRTIQEMPPRSLLPLLTRETRTRICNVFLIRSFRNSCSPSRLYHLLSLVQYFKSTYDFQTDDATMNILLKALLKCSRFDQQGMKALFDLLSMYGVLGGEKIAVFQTGGSLAMSKSKWPAKLSMAANRVLAIIIQHRLKGQENLLDIPSPVKLVSRPSFKPSELAPRFVIATYKMFIRAFFRKGDRASAHMLVGLLKQYHGALTTGRRDQKLLIRENRRRNAERCRKSMPSKHVSDAWYL
jgi:hypothetical protein